LQKSLVKGLELSHAERQKKIHQNRKLLGSENEPAIGDVGSSMELSGVTATSPLVGTVLGLTLLIDFPEEEGVISWESVDSYCNLPGYTGYGNNGSVRDYWYDVSNGMLEYTNYVTSYYYTAKYAKSYYTDPSIPYGQRARELILEALNYLDSQGFNFSTLSVDSNNRILAINAFYVGACPNAWAEGLWPHKGSMTDWFKADGVKSGDYQITNMGSSLYLGTFCHENGHLICKWPDLYDYGYESYGIGRYGLMAYGGQGGNPIPPNPYFRAAKGWETIVDITNSEDGTYYNNVANSNVTYQYSHPSLSTEYFLIESRIRSGRNANIPDEGLLIWHVDETGSNNYEQMTPTQHYRVSVEQADGLYHLEYKQNTGGSGDLFHAGWRDVFDDTTTPNAAWWSGEASGLQLTQISSVGTTMSFVKGVDFLTGDVDGDGDVDDADLALFSLQWLGNCTSPEWCGQCDFNQSGRVDFVDLSRLMAHWLNGVN